MTVMPGIEVIALEASELSIECEFTENTSHPHDSAEWIMFLNQCCDKAPAFRLACDMCCTERIISKYTAVETECCGAIIAPARKAYKRTEAL